jgi:hypothetical protein
MLFPLPPMTFAIPLDTIRLFHIRPFLLELISVVANLVRNYSPHLPPNTRTAPPTVELRRILKTAAKDMLLVFLRKCRAKRRLEKGKPSQDKGQAKGKRRAVNEVCLHRLNVDCRYDAEYLMEVEDTVLAKLLAQCESCDELYDILQEPNDIVLSEIEPILQQTGRFRALCMIYRQRGEHEKLLDVWSKCVPLHNSNLNRLRFFPDLQMASGQMMKL